MERSAQSRRSLAVAAALVALVIAVYWPVKNCAFVEYDDPYYVTDNPHVISGLTSENLSWAVKSGVAGNWHPVTWLTHMLDCEWFGLKPAGHHLTNLSWHALNTLLLFVFLHYATGAFWRSAAVAALFAIHP